MQSGFTANFELQYSPESLIIVPKFQLLKIQRQEHKFTIVWFQGLGDCPSYFLKFFLQEPILELMRNVKIVIPCPPQKTTTIAGGKVLNSWFDVLRRGPECFKEPIEKTFNVQHIEESLQLIEKVITEELKYVDQQRLLIGGFSQGCGMALHTAFKLNVNWAGVIAIGGYIFDVTPFNKQHTFPLKVFHGIQDSTRPWDEVKYGYERQGVQVHLVDGMKHEFDVRELKNQVVEFLREILTKKD